VTPVENNAASTTATVETNAASTTAPATKTLDQLDSAEYRNWRKTGELPSSEATPKTEDSATSTGAGKKPDETAPGSDPEKKKEPDQRRGAPEEKRIPQLLSERNAEKRAREVAEAKVRELEAQIASGKKPDEKPADSSSAAAKPTRSKPTPDDVDPKTKQPKYATYEDFVEDLADWRAEQRIATRDAEQEATKAKEVKTQREAEAAKLRESDEQALAKMHGDGKKRFKDYDDVVFGENSAIQRIPDNSVMDKYLLQVIRKDAALGADILYHLAKHGEQLDTIAALDNDAQHEAMVELKLTVSGKTKAPEKKHTAAPNPPAQVGAQGTAAADPVAAAVKADDFAAYKRAMDAADLKK
jgi:hypothetical protein